MHATIYNRLLFLAVFFVYSFHLEVLELLLVWNCATSFISSSTDRSVRPYNFSNPEFFYMLLICLDHPHKIAVAWPKPLSYPSQYLHIMKRDSKRNPLYLEYNKETEL